MSIARFASVVAVAVTLLVAPAPQPAHAGLTKGLKCAFAKQRVALKTTGALLTCERKALTAQTPVDPTCIAVAIGRFEEAFRKIEMKGGCEPAGDADAIELIVDRCAQQLGQQLQGTCSASGEACGGGAPPCCTGLVCSGVIGQPPTCKP
jgi:hypothetical protein